MRRAALSSTPADRWGKSWDLDLDRKQGVASFKQHHLTNAVVGMPHRHHPHHRRSRAVSRLTLLAAVLFASWIAYFGMRLSSASLSNQESSSSSSPLRPEAPHEAVTTAAAAAAVISDEWVYLSSSAAATWTFDKREAVRAQQYLLKRTGRAFPPLTAHVEPPLAENNNNTSTGPRLPLRAHGPDALRSYTYPLDEDACGQLQAYLPTFHSADLDGAFGSNMQRQHPLFPQRFDYAASVCPVDADPFLPWIHDVFPVQDGTFMEFIAHNKRKCNTQPSVFRDDLENLAPQVSLMQPVPVQRMTHQEALQMHPELLWRNTPPNNNGGDGDDQPVTRYRLATTFHEADEDAKETRFICQFYTHQLDASSLSSTFNQKLLRRVVLGETLSVYPYNYEFANYMKPRSTPMLTPATKGNDEQIWNSVLHFRCPVPKHLQHVVASGQSIVLSGKDTTGDADTFAGVATIFMDLVPIRTHPRTNREGFIEGVVPTNFDPLVEWGPQHVLPLVQASGRWSNIPICRPPALAFSSNQDHVKYNGDSNVVDRKRQQNLQDQQQLQQQPGQYSGDIGDNRNGSSRTAQTQQRHYLIGCLWASASFTTRGSSVPDTSTSDRLLEWLVYHLFLAKFDHIYVYDNTPTTTTTTTTTTNTTLVERNTLAAVTNLFTPDRVTRIPWPHRICNNNKPANRNPGERSSQYASEASCRVRYGPYTEWLAAFDADEYLIPLKNWTDLQHWLREGVDKINNQTHILSFFQTRSRPIADLMEPFADGGFCGQNIENAVCLAKRPDKTFMETYDCEPTPLPKPEYGWRAMKQIIRPWYVLNHYVHYSTVTRRLLDAPKEPSPRFVQKYPYERRVDELGEAFMLHAKTTWPEATVDWRVECSQQAGNSSSCPVGIPWPKDMVQKEETTSKIDRGAMRFNCFRHERVTNEVVPNLKIAMAPLLERYHNDPRQ